MLPPAGTIDLGELPHGEQPEILDPRPVRARFRRWRNLPTWRVAGAAAAAALVLVTAAAAAARPHPPLTLQLSIRAADFNVVTDERHLYVFEDTTTTGDAVVVAYRLADGTAAWRTPVPGERGGLGLWDEALLVTTYTTASGGDLWTDQTTRLDRDSGRPLWTKAGWPGRMVGDHVLFSRSLTAEPGQHELSSLAMTDLETGEAVWSIEANRWDYGSGGTPPTLVTLDSESVLASYDLASGELLATVPTAAPTDPDHPSYWELRSLGSLVLLREQSDGEMVFSAYDAATLQRRWTRQPGVNMWAARCGDLLCLVDLADVPRALDPDTGRTVWSADWLEPATAETGFDIYDPGLSELAGYAVLSNVRLVASGSRSWLIDVETGRPVLDLRQWRFAERFGLMSGGSPSALLTLRTQTGTWVGRLRPDLSGIDALGQIEGATIDENGFGTYCGSAAGYIICNTDVLGGDELAHTNVEVWRLP